ncbi:unnamed protein product, partial [Ectocarpus fasciculatus]
MDPPTGTLPTMMMAPVPEWGGVPGTDNSAMATSTASPPPSFAAAPRPLSPPTPYCGSAVNPTSRFAASSAASFAGSGGGSFPLGRDGGYHEQQQQQQQQHEFSTPFVFGTAATESSHNDSVHGGMMLTEHLQYHQQQPHQQYQHQREEVRHRKSEREHQYVASEGDRGVEAAYR